MDSDKPTQLTSAGEEVPDPEEEQRRLAALARDANRLPALRLVLLGWRWPGKSLTGNTILGREEFRLERAAEFCVKRETTVDGRQVTVVDTPGWFSAQATPAVYQQEIVRSATLCPPGPHAFLLVIPTGMFTETDRARIEEHVSLFGEAVWRHTLVVFTWSEALRQRSIERHIRREGADLQWVVEQCHKRYHVINNQVFGEHPQLPRLMEKIEKMVAQEGGHYSLDLAAAEKPPQTQNQAQNQGQHENQNQGQHENQNQGQHENQNQGQNENQSPNAVAERRELGARPKQHCSTSSLRAMDVDPPDSLEDDLSD